MEDRQFSVNIYKKKVKAWVTDNPSGSLSDLVDFCEELIPVQQFTTHQWLIDQTRQWYTFVQSQKSDDIDFD